MKLLAHMATFFYGTIVWMLLLPAIEIYAQEELPPAGKSVSLEDCVRLALQFHPSLSAGRASVDAQKARVEQALSAYYPQVDYKTTYSTATSNYSGSRAPSHSWNFSDVFSTGPSLYQ